MNIFDRLAAAFGFSNSDPQEEPPLLKDLDQVPWESLKHAYGVATDTPGLIRNLASPDRYTRIEARDRLSETIYHQGSIYPAAVAATPFLIALLEVDSLPEKHALLDLLAMLARGGSWHDTHQHLELFEEKRKSPEFQARVKEERSWVADLQDEFKKHRAVLVNFLNDPQVQNRLSASHLLSYLPEIKAQSVPALQDRLDQEVDQDVRANLLFALFVLDRDHLGPFFEQAWKKEREDLPRCVALMQHVLLAKGETSPEALDRLLQCILSAEEDLIQRYNKLPSTSEFLSDMTVPLALASPRYGQQVLPWFIDQVEKRRMVGESCAMGLLAVALVRDGQIADLTKLDDLQKRAVLSIARMAWSSPNRVFANMVGVLRRFGLPETPEEMSDLLGYSIFAT